MHKEEKGLAQGNTLHDEESSAHKATQTQSWREETPELVVDDLFRASVEDNAEKVQEDKSTESLSQPKTDTAKQQNHAQQGYTEHGEEIQARDGDYQTPSPGGTTIINNYIQAPAETTNTLGLTGFILSIVAFILSWIPILGGLLWLVGAILSIVGLFKAPRGFAIAGTIISFLMIFVFLFFFMGFMMLAAMSTY